MPVLNIDVQIDTDDIWCEEDESISKALKLSIQNEVVSAVKKQALQAINNCIDEFVRDYVTGCIKGVMDKAVMDMIDGGMKFKPQYSKEDVTVSDYVHSKFGDYRIVEAIDSYVKNQSKELTEELKRQYDVKFASKIVEGIANQGLLKSEAAKLLLGE